MPTYIGYIKAIDPPYDTSSAATFGAGIRADVRYVINYLEHEYVGPELHRVLERLRTVVGESE
jgi:hypothetical protein